MPSTLWPAPLPQVSEMKWRVANPPPERVLR
jgi:hypothetical protein